MRATALKRLAVLISSGNRHISKPTLIVVNQTEENFKKISQN